MTTSTPIVEPFYVVDTNALIWYLTTDQKLSQPASAIFEAAERGETILYIPAIVLAELYYANQKWNFFSNFSQVYNDLKSGSQYRFIPLNPDEILDFAQNSAVPEMHDRMIVGMARRLNAPLITIDLKIHAANLVRIVW